MDGVEIFRYGYLAVQFVLTGFLFYFSFKILVILYTLSPFYKGNVPFVPSRMGFIRKAFQLLDIREGERVLDLGSGTGRFIKYASRRVNAEFVGIELNNFLYLCSRLNMLCTRKKGTVQIISGSYDDEKWYDYQKIFMFNMPSEIKRILPRLEKELEPGALVASVIFPIPSKKFRERARYNCGKDSLFLYERVD